MQKRYVPAVIAIALLLMPVSAFALGDCNNDEVVKVVRSGRYTDDFVARNLQKTRNCKFDVSPAAIDKLKAAGVGKLTIAVMEEMTNPNPFGGNQPSEPAAPTPSSSGQNNADGVLLYKSGNSRPIALKNEVIDMAGGGINGKMGVLTGNLWHGNKITQQLAGTTSLTSVDTGDVYLVAKGATAFNGKVTLIRLKEEKGNRVVATTKGRLNLSTKKDSIDTKITWNNDDATIKPSQPLEPGHYALAIGDAYLFTFDVAEITARAEN